MRGNNIIARCAKSITEFNKQAEQHNSSLDSEFRISIAHGFFIYDSECGVERIQDAYKKADEKMYETKRAMKARQIPPEEFYSEVRGLRNKT